MDINSTLALNNGVNMPYLGLGLWKIEGADTVKAIRYAADAGYRHLDGAKIYQNEQGVGAGVRKCGVPREKLFVTSKLWNSDMRASKQQEAFEKTLKDLGLEYLDLYLIHWPVENFSESWKFMEKLLKSERVKAIGVSNFQIHHLETLFKILEIVPAVNQFECHPYLSQKPLLEYCTSKKIVCEAYGPLGGQGSGLHRDNILKDIGALYGKTPAQIALRWNIQRGLAVIPKSVNKRRIEENSRLFDFELSRADMDKIDGLNQDKRYNADPDNFRF